MVTPYEADAILLGIGDVIDIAAALVILRNLELQLVGAGLSRRERFVGTEDIALVVRLTARSSLGAEARSYESQICRDVVTNANILGRVALVSERNGVGNTLAATDGCGTGLRLEEVQVARTVDRGERMSDVIALVRILRIAGNNSSVGRSHCRAVIARIRRGEDKVDLLRLSCAQRSNGALHLGIVVGKLAGCVAAEGAECHAHRHNISHQHGVGGARTVVGDGDHVFHVIAGLDKVRTGLGNRQVGLLRSGAR